MDVNIVINIALGMFLVTATGYFLRKKGLIDGDFSKRLSKLVLHVTQPAMIISSMLKLSYSAENAKTAGITLLISLGTHAAAALVGWLTMKVIKDENARKISEHGLIFSNCMFFGLPIVESIFGNAGAFKASMFSIVFHIFSWTYGLVILGRGRDDIKPDFKKAVFNYGTIPCAIGVALFFLNLKIPSFATTALGYLGGLCTPISLLVLGGAMSTTPLKKLFGDWRLYYTGVIRLIAFPLLIYITAKYAIGLDQETSLFALIMAGLPTASLTNMFAELYDVNPGYASSLVGTTTAFSVATLPLLAYVATLI